MNKLLLDSPTRDLANQATADAIHANAEIRLTESRLIQFDFVRATEMAALNCHSWIGKGEKESADAAACDAMRGMFDVMDIRGEVIIGEGIKDEAPGLFAGERVGTWRAGAPRVDIAVDPLDGTTNLSKGLPNSISCIAVALRDDENIPALQHIPAFYMKKLAYPSAVRQAWIKDASLPLDINAPFKDFIALTARLLHKNVRDVVVMVLDRPRNAEIIEEIRSAGAKLRMIVDGDIAAALGPAIADSGVDLYAGIGGAPEGILAAAGLRCMGGGMQAQMWPRDEKELASLVECGWSDRVDKVYRSRDLVHGNDVLFVATGISDSPLLRGLKAKGQKVVTHSVMMRQHTGTIRFIRTEHDLDRRSLRRRLAISRQQTVLSGRCEPQSRNSFTPHAIEAREPTIKSVLLFGPPGSGKGIIGKALAALPSISHCSSGDIIRRAIANSADNEAYVRQMASGKLLPDDILWQLFDEFLRSFSATATASKDSPLLLLDGIPRCQSQIDELLRRVAVQGVIYLDCGDQDQLIRRLLRRAEVQGRVDDADKEVISDRLKLFYAETLPLLDCFPPDMVHNVDGTQAPEKVLFDALNGMTQMREP